MALPARAADSAPFMEYDVSEWPYVKAVVKPVYPDPDTFQAHLDCFSELLTRGEKFVMMFDLELAKMPSMALLHQLASFMQQHRPHIEANLIASAVVTSSLMVQGALKILFTLKQPVRPNMSFSAQAEAKDWLGKRWTEAVRAAAFT